MKSIKLAKKFENCNFKFFRKNGIYIGEYKSKDIKKDEWIGQQKIKSCMPIDAESIKVILK